MKHRLDFLRLWMRNFFKHPVENIRQANPIVPRRLYSNFGNICKARPYTAQELRIIENTEKARQVANTAVNSYGYTPEGLLEMVRSMGADKKAVQRLQYDLSQPDVLPKCHICDFNLRGIPCPIHNLLADGSTVCDSHRYVIIKPAAHVY